jgi:hypothetical protein
MKVSELSGLALDIWVARAEGHTVESRFRHEANTNIPVIVADGATRGVPKYSSDWAQGGPIIARECIGFTTWLSGDWCAAVGLNAETHFDGGVLDGAHWQIGPHPLVASMRTRVAKVFGEEVSDGLPA